MPKIERKYPDRPILPICEPDEDCTPALLDKSYGLRNTLYRIDRLSERIRGHLFGFGKEDDEPRPSPDNLQGVIDESSDVASTIEHTLELVLNRLAGEDA